MIVVHSRRHLVCVESVCLVIKKVTNEENN